jgi:hypothetical protein
MIDKTKEGALGLVSYLNRKKSVFHLKKEKTFSKYVVRAKNIPSWSDRLEQTLTLILDE